MKKLLENLNYNLLIGVFLASMLGSLSLTALLQYAIEPGVPLTIEARIALTLAGLAIYAAVVCITFYVTVPEYRPALRRILGDKEQTES